MSEEKYYPKTKELLCSMAMRGDHAFGLHNEEKRNKIIEKMDKLYDAYSSNKTNEQINEMFNYGLITIKQIREEVNGTGFFKPIEIEKSHIPFGKKI